MKMRRKEKERERRKVYLWWHFWELIGSLKDDLAVRWEKKRNCPIYKRLFILVISKWASRASATFSTNSGHRDVYLPVFPVFPPLFVFPRIDETQDFLSASLPLIFVSFGIDGSIFSSIYFPFCTVFRDFTARQIFRDPQKETLTLLMGLLRPSQDTDCCQNIN